MPVLTDELRKQLPPLQSQEKEKDPLLICKYFMPLNRWVWYPIEFDGDDIAAAPTLFTVEKTL